MTAARPQIVALIPALLIGIAQPVGANAGDAALRTDDLDLTTPTGRATLEKRIAAAERQACMGVTATGSRSRAAQQQKDCRAKVRQQIAARIPAVRLAATEQPH